MVSKYIFICLHFLLHIFIILLLESIICFNAFECFSHNFNMNFLVVWNFCNLFPPLLKRDELSCNRSWGWSCWNFETLQPSKLNFTRSTFFNYVPKHLITRSKDVLDQIPLMDFCQVMVIVVLLYLISGWCWDFSTISVVWKISLRNGALWCNWCTHTVCHFGCVPFNCDRYAIEATFVTQLCKKNYLWPSSRGGKEKFNTLRGATILISGEKTPFPHFNFILNYTAFNERCICGVCTFACYGTILTGEENTFSPNFGKLRVILSKKCSKVDPEMR